MNILTTILADVATTPIVEVAEESVKEFDLLALTMKGGIIMIPLLLLSILAIYVFFERWSAIRKAAKADNTFMARIKDCIYEGDIASARNLCKKTDTPYARLIEKGISRLGRPMNDVLVAIDLSTGEFHIESENIEEVISIHDDLFTYRGLDAEDINNFFLVAEYIKLTQRENKIY